MDSLNAAFLVSKRTGSRRRRRLGLRDAILACGRSTMGLGMLVVGLVLTARARLLLRSCDYRVEPSTCLDALLLTSPTEIVLGYKGKTLLHGFVAASSCKRGGRCGPRSVLLTFP